MKRSKRGRLVDEGIRGISVVTRDESVGTARIEVSGVEDQAMILFCSENSSGAHEGRRL